MRGIARQLRVMYRAWLCDQCGTWNEHDAFSCFNCYSARTC